jgi:Protein of unknown function (DUF2793)
MSETPNLALPLLAAAQAQKHVTHNEALMLLDALTQLAVRDHVPTPPPVVNDGERFLVGPAATGAFAGQTDRIALNDGGLWRFLAPRAGWTVWIEDESLARVHDGTGWIVSSPTQTARLGINAMADTTNRLSVTSPAALFNHEGAGCQIKINKASATETASLLYQTAFAGRAEMGLTGSDAFRIKVSTDGAVWRDGLVIAGATGFAGFGTASPTCRIDAAGPVRVGQYAKAALPSAASSGAGATVFVSDEAGGPVLAFSDGTAWRRVTDRAVVS